MVVKEILKRSDYQTFDFLGDHRKGSDSGKKWELSKLEEFDLKGRTCLDIGCNAGYFLFRLLGKEPQSLVGIDLGERFINIAKDLNKELFKSEILTFIYGDVFSFDFERKFDLIVCFSSFHYFIGKQQDFITKCFDLLNDDGVLLLEVEEYPNNIISELSNEPRPADKGRYDYPNYLKMKEYVSGIFGIVERYKSVNIGGSLYDRYFYRLQKRYGMRPGMRPLIGEYKKTIIIITGLATIGKSTLCNEMIGDRLDYISSDIACLAIEHEVKEIGEFMDLLREGVCMNPKLSDTCCKVFVDYFFVKYIKRNQSPNILVDGFIFTLENVYNLFLAKCKEYGYRVWKTERIF
jgi:SAM-dependent methyltransferase